LGVPPINGATAPGDLLSMIKSPIDHHFLEAWNLEPGTSVILTVPFMRHVIITHDIDFKLDLTAKNFSR
jgi:hypothetical protein